MGLFFKTESEITPEALDVAVRTALARPASTNADDEAEIVEGVEREDKVAPRWVAIAVAAAILLVGASLTTWVVVSGVLEPDGLRNMTQKQFRAATVQEHEWFIWLRNLTLLYATVVAGYLVGDGTTSALDVRKSNRRKQARRR